MLGCEGGVVVVCAVGEGKGRGFGDGMKGWVGWALELGYVNEFMVFFLYVLGL